MKIAVFFILARMESTAVLYFLRFGVKLHFTRRIEKNTPKISTTGKRQNGAITQIMIGMVLIGCAYPVYNRVIKKEREKIAPEILRLTDELMQ